MKAVLTVDPGVFTMGFCLWNYRQFFDDYVAYPDVTGDMVIKDSQRHRVFTPEQAMEKHINELKKLFSTNEIVRCYCEKPQMFPSARGFASAIQGHILQMEMFRGMLLSLCLEYTCDFIDVPVVKWKGQLPKSLVIDRIKEFYRNQEKGIKLLSMSLDGNDWDALGIGLYLQGVFK